MNSTTKISFRLDDICPSMNWNSFYKVIKILDRNNIKPLLGIVPDCRDNTLNIDELNRNFYKIMKKYQENGFVIAQHGYTHVYDSQSKGMLGISKKSEFAGKSYDEQFRLLQTGKSILEMNGIKTNIFMAPSHSYDKITLIALKSLGFKYITDGYTRTNYTFENLIFIPCMNVVSLKRKIRGICTICLHSNSMGKEDFLRLEKFITKYKSDCIDYGVLMKEKPQNFARSLREKWNLAMYKLEKAIL